LLIGAKINYKDNKYFKKKFYNLNSKYRIPRNMMMCSGVDSSVIRLYPPHLWMLLETKPLKSLLDLFKKPSAEWWSERGVIIRYERRGFFWDNEHINIYSRVREEWEDLGTEVWDISKFSSKSLKDISKWY